jgi:hypothetical protein
VDAPRGWHSRRPWPPLMAYCHYYLFS